MEENGSQTKFLPFIFLSLWNWQTLKPHNVQAINGVSVKINRNEFLFSLYISTCKHLYRLLFQFHDLLSVEITL